MGKQTKTEQQLDLFKNLKGSGYVPIPRPVDMSSGVMDVDRHLRNGLKLAIETSGKSRLEIATEMTRLIYGDNPETEISVNMLNRWTAPSASDWRFPATYLPAFVSVTSALWLLDVIAEPAGGKVLASEAAILANISLAQRKAKQAAEEAAEWERRLEQASGGVVAALPSGPARDARAMA